MMMIVHIYTDGSCLGNPGAGGWGVYLTLVKNDVEVHSKCLHGSDEETTNQRMELTAAIEGLRAIVKPCDITLWTDSAYVAKGIKEWVPNWIARGWRTSGGKPVANRELWEDLIGVIADLEEMGCSISVEQVKGHSGVMGNEIANRLAQRGAKEAVI